MSEQTRILDFLALAERLKTELRHSWLSSGRRDSVADDPGARSGRGDVPFFDDSGRAQKPARERAAIESIRRHLGPPLGEEFHDLWHEFERNSSAEARLARALDHLEVQIQHNLAALESWTPAESDLVYTKMDRHCAYDPFLAGLCAAVKEQAESKMRAAGVDVEALRQRHGVDSPPADGGHLTG